MNCKSNKESNKYLQYTSIVPFCVHQKPSEVLCPRILQNHSPLWWPPSPVDEACSQLYHFGRMSTEERERVESSRAAFLGICFSFMLQLHISWGKLYGRSHDRWFRNKLAAGWNLIVKMSFRFDVLGMFRSFWLKTRTNPTWCFSTYSQQADDLFFFEEFRFPVLFLSMNCIILLALRFKIRLNLKLLFVRFFPSFCYLNAPWIL